MNNKQWGLTVTALALAITSAGGYWLGQRHGMSQAAGAAMERKVLYWYDPMVPTQHFDKPGKSPFMDMQLQPKYASEATNNNEPEGQSMGIRIDSRITQNLGVRFATVQRGVVSQSIEAAGTIGFNERDIAIVQTRTTGFVTQVYQRAAGDVISKNQPLVDVLSPEWAGAQTEFLALLKSNDAALIAAARQRLTLLGMDDGLIARIENTRQSQATLTMTSPIAGVIDTLEVRTGMTLSAGATLAKINGIDTVWLEAAVPETQSAAVQVGSRVTAQLAAFPGEPIAGTVVAILPEANTNTRTVRVRIELPNPKHRLRPGMFAQVQVNRSDSQPVLLAPAEAVIRSGTRNLVIVANDADHFQPVEVQVGPTAQNQTVILAGLQAGQKIVTSGQFLIDSEASLQGVIARMNAGSPP